MSDIDNRIYRFGVLTVSDKGAKGEREDTSGPYIIGEFKKRGYSLEYQKIISDDKTGISKEIEKVCDKAKLSLLITTGGTGLSPRDNTPEATLEVLDKCALGISEYMRAKGVLITPFASLSRGVSGIRKSTLVINLPGSLKSVKENLSFIIDDVIPHALKMLLGDSSHT